MATAMPQIASMECFMTDNEILLNDNEQHEEEIELEEQSDVLDDGESETDDGEEGAVDKADESDSEDDEVVVSIEGEEAPQEDKNTPLWVKETRKRNRELEKQNRELKERFDGYVYNAAPVALGAEPTLEDCDYDADVFKAKYADYLERKRKVDEQVKQEQQKIQKEQEEWNKKVEAYEDAKKSLRVKDFEDAEDAIKGKFSIQQQGIIVAGSNNPATIVYALGKNPKVADELAKIDDHIKFAFAVSKLEERLKVTNRKAPPPPEKPVRTSGGSVNATDSTLERLRQEAEKTGDYSKVIAYRNKIKA